MENNCCYINNLIRTLQGIANQAGSYAVNDGWMNHQELPQQQAGYNVGLILVICIVAFLFLRRPKKAKIESSGGEEWTFDSYITICFGIEGFYWWVGLKIMWEKGREFLDLGEGERCWMRGEYGRWGSFKISDIWLFNTLDIFICHYSHYVKYKLLI